MKPHSKLPQDFGQWIVASLDGTITQAQFSQLDQVISSKPEARLYYLEFISTYVGLVGALPLPANIMAEENAEDLDMLALTAESQDTDRVRQIEQYAKEQLDSFLEQELDTGKSGAR